PLSPCPIGPCDPGAAMRSPFGRRSRNYSPARRGNWAVCGCGHNQRNYSCELRYPLHPSRRCWLRPRPLRRVELFARRDRFAADSSNYPQRYLVDHILKNVSAGIIPKKSPVDEALWIEIVRRCFALELFPNNMFEIAVRGDCPFPSPVRTVAIMMRVNCRDGPQAIWRGE